MKKPVFTGAGVAIITPMYEDGSINFDELGRIIEDQIARHTDAIYHLTAPPATCSTMTDEEQLAAIEVHRGYGQSPRTGQLPVPVRTIPTTAAHWQQSLPPAVPMPC